MRPSPACPTLALLGTLLAASAAHAVSEAACLWLLITPSARSAGLGGTVSPLSDDPTDSWFAPGLGAARPLPESRWIEVDVSGYPEPVDWLPLFHDDIGLENWNLGLRLDLDRARRRLGDHEALRWPLTLELRLMGIGIDEGAQTTTDEDGNVLGVIHSRETSRSLRLGLGTHGERWSLAAGLGYDFIRSDLGSGLVGNQLVGVGKASSLDLGLNGRFALLHEESNGLLTDWSVGLQFSRLFVGGRISYVDENKADPLPRHDRIGFGTRLAFGLPAKSALRELPLLELHAAMEHSASLVRKYVESSQPMMIADDQGNQATAYWDLYGDLTTNPLDEYGHPNPPAIYYRYATDYRFFNGGLFRQNDDTVQSWGLELGLLSTLTVRSGHFTDDSGLIHENTQGWTLSSRGPLELAARYLTGKVGRLAATASEHVEFQWSWAKTESDSPRSGTEYSEVRVTLGF